MLKKLFISVFIIISFNAVSAAEKIRSYQVHVNPMKMNQIAERFEVVKKLASGYEVYVKNEDVDAFLKLTPNAKLLLENMTERLKQQMTL
jgi:hypothetical protein